MLAGLAFLGKVALISIGCGIGPFLYLLPARLRNGLLGVTLLLTFGLAMVLVAAVYCVALGIEVKFAVPAVACLSAGFLAWGMRRPADLASRLASCLRAAVTWKYHLALALLIALVAVSPGLRGGLEQPIRVGVDEMGYAITGQYLLDGGSLGALKKELVTQTGEPALAEAMAANAKALDVKTNIAAEFLLKSLRWYPAGIAAVLAALGEHFVLPCQFVLLYFPLVLLFGVSYHFLRTVTAVPEALAVLGAGALVLNANLLNVLCEGQHAQVFGAPFFFLLLGQLYYLRNGPESVAAEGAKDMRQEYVATALLSTIMLCTYPELLFLTGVLGGLMLALDLVTRRGKVNGGLFRFAALVAVGLVLAGPYGVGLPAFYLSHLKHLQTGGGFWQPQWAQPAEILGLFNIYNPAVPEYVGRSLRNRFLVTSMSILCVEVVAMRILAGTKWDKSYWLAPVLFVAAVFVKVYYVNKLHNYQYMKAYTLVLLPLFCFFAASLYHVCTAVRVPILVPAGCMLWVAVAGVGYLRDYRKDAAYLSCSADRLDHLKASVGWDKYVWLTTSKGTENLGYGSLVRFGWLNLGWELPNIAPHLGKRIGIWCYRSDFANCGDEAKALPVLYQDGEVVLLDSGTDLDEDLLTANTGLEMGNKTKKERFACACTEFLRGLGFK